MRISDQSIADIMTFALKSLINDIEDDSEIPHNSKNLVILAIQRKITGLKIAIQDAPVNDTIRKLT